MVVTGSGEKSSLLLTVMLTVVSTTGPWWLLSCSLLAFLACFLKKPNMLRASSPTSGVSLADAPKEAHGRRRLTTRWRHPCSPWRHARARKSRLDLSVVVHRSRREGGGTNVKTTSAQNFNFVRFVGRERARFISHRFTRCLFWGLVSFLRQSPSLLWPRRQAYCSTDVRSRLHTPVKSLVSLTHCAI